MTCSRNPEESRLTNSLSNTLLVLGAGALLAGCQPTLKSTLPTGEAGYQAIAVAPEVANPTRYVLQPGDKISIDVFQEAELSLASALVDEAGYVSVPLVGELQARGLTTNQLARELERAYASRYLREPNVNVTLLEASPRFMSVEGEVSEPGIYPVRPGYTLLSAMAVAGSPERTAKLDEVLIFRQVDGQRVGGRFDIQEIRAGRMADPQVLPGDVIVVGYSSVRGGYQDFLQLAPIFGIFTRF